MAVFSAAQAAAIVAAYQAGASLSELATHYDASVPTIQRVLVRAGIERRPQGGNNNPSGRRGQP